ncbi:g6f-like [Thalassophryne amazonica]|uniref:g6f-like n=1 Tax=Thalassophryne amazonica TaxID=390379 RepID=UPI001470CA6B|nr:g6f-like [Thalassophryne amazonica]
MEFGFLTLIIFSSMIGYFSHFTMCFTDWDDLVITREDTPTLLVCTDTMMTSTTEVNWRMKSHISDDWKLVLLANIKRDFSASASMANMHLADKNFQDSGDFSLACLPKMEDIGLYSCLIKQQDRKLKEKTILLAIITVLVFPALPIPQHSTLKLIASVNPSFATTKITWAAPGGIPIRSEVIENMGTVAKIPQVTISDSGTYVCMSHPRGNSSKALFAYNVDVTIDADTVASFTNIIHAPEIVTAIQADTPFPLSCPPVHGDYVQLHWKPPDMETHDRIKQLYGFNRWTGSTMLFQQRKILQLASSPYDGQSGIFSFLLTPVVSDGGLYICEVFFNDNVFSQRTLLSVLQVTTSRFSSKLELWCNYSERSQVQSVDWKYQNQSHELQLSSHSSDWTAAIIATLPLPITPDTAGNYTCTIQLKNGRASRPHTLWHCPLKALPRGVGIKLRSCHWKMDSCFYFIFFPFADVITSSLPPSLSALLLLVPLLSVGLGVLLWRQKHISERSIEQSLSVYSGDAENIYEAPEDIRQVLPQGSVYMDLKPRGEDDVYKELERYEQCHS